MKIVEFANRIDPDQAAHNEPPHQDLCCLPSRFCIFNLIYLGQNIFMPPTSEKLRGHIGLGLSARPSVRPSIILGS